MNQRNHPIWEIARILSWGLVAVAALYICATNFDETEIKAWGLILGGGGAASLGINWMQKRSEKDD